MAAPADHRRFAFVLYFTLLLTLHAAFLHLCTARPTPGRISGFQQQIDAIYNFGDSISDTGNRLREDPYDNAGALPYGVTWGEPTGRCSDGLLMIDYLAESLGLPYLPPYLDESANFDHGANFAVIGASALDRSFFLEKGVNVTFTNSSLSVQLEWFKTLLNSLCTTKEECKERLERALFLVGEIGGNDYGYASMGSRNNTLEEVKAYYVPLVVDRIVKATKELINLGAINLIVPGHFPIGCIPCFLQAFHPGQMSCVRLMNEYAKFHNGQLQGALNRLRMDHPGVSIKYADYYNPFLALLTGAGSYGFNHDSLFKACCGIGGAYNFDLRHPCGTPGVPVCENPAKFISWDGVHPTQEAYKNMAAQIFGLTLPTTKMVLDN